MAAERDLTIQRFRFRNVGTTGRAQIGKDGWCCDTLEPPRKFCIPAGVYLAYGQDFPDGLSGGGMGTKAYELLDVPGLSHAQINQAQIDTAWAGDVGMGLYFNLRGLIALGEGFDILRPPDIKFRPQLALLHSRAILASFMRQTNGFAITVHIIDP